MAVFSIVRKVVRLSPALGRPLGFQSDAWPAVLVCLNEYHAGRRAEGLAAAKAIAGLAEDVG